MNQPGTDTEYPNWQIPLADGSGAPGAARGPHRLAAGGRRWQPRSAVGLDA